jgi:hypothetical protein
VAIAGGICTTLVAAIGKLWAENRALRRELDTARLENITLQQQSFREHRRDLRTLVGLPTSLDPGPLDPLRPPVLIREVDRGPPPKRRVRIKKA